jgi:hypothetical protein
LKPVIAVLAASIVGLLTASAASPSFDLQAAFDEARRNTRVNPGHDYEIKVGPIVHEALGDAIKECAGAQPHWEADFKVTVIVATDGRVERILSFSRQALVLCAIKKARSQLILPRPPEGSWPICMRLAFQYWK